MRVRAWIAIFVATGFSLLAAYFGWSFVSRAQQVHRQATALKSDLQNWATEKKPTLDKILNRVDELTKQLTIEEIKKQVADATQARMSDLLELLRARLSEKAGPVEQIMDEFEDEFGRPIKLMPGPPPQYDIGAEPSWISDPLRLGSRSKTWAKATVACVAYNELSRLLQPKIDQNESDRVSQQGLVEDAIKQIQQLTGQREVAQADQTGLMSVPRANVPSAEDVRKKLANSAIVAGIFGISDGIAFLSSLTLACSVWLRAFLIGGWFRATRILPEDSHAAATNP